MSNGIGGRVSFVLNHFVRRMYRLARMPDLFYSSAECMKVDIVNEPEPLCFRKVISVIR